MGLTFGQSFDNIIKKYNIRITDTPDNKEKIINFIKPLLITSLMPLVKYTKYISKAAAHITVMADAVISTLRAHLLSRNHPLYINI